MTDVITREPDINTVEQAWERIKQARASYNAAPDDDEDAERRHWAIVDAAERQIHEGQGTTLRAVEIKLWLNLWHATNYKQDEQDVIAEDVASLAARECTFDWTARLVLSAIKSLRTMEA